MLPSVAPEARMEFGAVPLKAGVGHLVLKGARASCLGVENRQLSKLYESFDPSRDV